MVETSDGQVGCEYCANDFLEYVNTIVLKDACERAYFIASGPVHVCLNF